MKPLSPRERQMVKLLCEDGLTTSEAAAQLGIAKKTAQFHRINVMLKLGANGTARMMAVALAHGYVTIPAKE